MLLASSDSRNEFINQGGLFHAWPSEHWPAGIGVPTSLARTVTVSGKTLAPPAGSKVSPSRAGCWLLAVLVVVVVAAAIVVVIASSIVSCWAIQAPAGGREQGFTLHRATHHKGGGGEEGERDSKNMDRDVCYKQRGRRRSNETAELLQRGAGTAPEVIHPSFV